MNIVHENTSRPKNKCGWRNYLMWFMFNLQRRKIHTLVHNDIQYLRVDSLRVKKKYPLVAIRAWCEPHSTLIPCWKSTAYFPQATGPNPFPQACPPFSTPHAHSCNIILLWKTTSACRNLSPSASDRSWLREVSLAIHEIFTSFL
jgi:hypothetical protein